MPQLSLNILGQFSASLAAQKINDFRSIKNQALFIYLMVESAYAHQREKLCTLFWPEMPERSARHNLRQGLYTLGQIFPDISSGPGDPPVHLLLVNRQTVQLNPQASVESDVHILDQLLAKTQTHPHADLIKCPTCISVLGQVTSLYRGDFLMDFYLEDSGEYENWATANRSAYQRKILDTLQILANAALEKQEYDRASIYVDRQLAMDSLRESAHSQKMKVFALSGRRVEAVRHYHHYARLLNDELGISPSQESKDLFEHIRAQNLIVNSTFSETRQSQPVTSHHNLPLQPTPFIGRKTELTELEAMITDPYTRLVTIVGPGGIGKTRLALGLAASQISSQESHLFRHGIYIVSLERLESSDLLLSAIAEDIGFRFMGGNDLQEQLLRYLAPKAMLLVLDNFEYLIEGARLVDEILISAPRVKIIITSRVRLNLHIEQVFPIKGMAYPQGNSAASADDTLAITNYGAVQLFIQCARRVRPDFKITAANQHYILDICCLLKGMPLGLVLAASWLGSLSPADISREMRADIDFLVTEMGDIPRRQRSLRAAFDHSWQLLSKWEREIFCQMSIFRGGFTYDAARKITRAGVHDLQALVNKSLLTLATNGRYEVHELLRQYSAEKLQDVPQLETSVLERYSSYYLNLLLQHTSDWYASQQLEALAKLTSEADNVQHAWRWAIQHEAWEMQ